MAHRDEPTPVPELEEEGIPDHAGPLPEKEATGDAQEGVAPPRDHAVAAEDLGATAEGQREGDSLDERIAREEPDVLPEDEWGVVPGREDHRGEGHRSGRVVEPSGQGAGTDAEKDELGEDRPGDAGDYSDEERAVRVREEPS